LCVWTGTTLGAKCGKEYNRDTDKSETMRCVEYKYKGKLYNNNQCYKGWRNEIYDKRCAFKVDSNKNVLQWMDDCGKVSCPQLTGVPECPSMAPGDLDGRWEVEKGIKTLKQCRDICMKDPSAIGMTTNAGATETKADKCFCEYGVTGVHSSWTSYKTCVFKGKH